MYEPCEVVRNIPQYKIGDKVWLNVQHLDLKVPTKKLAHKRLGPFPITQVVSSNAMRLKLPKSYKIHDVINVSRLLPYHPPTIPGQEAPPPPPPIEIEGEKEYEVEEILDSRIYRNKFQYLVKWKGYSHEENTWEPESNLENSKNLITSFHSKHPSAPRRMNASFFHNLTQFRPICTITTLSYSPNIEKRFKGPFFHHERLEYSEHIP